ncbi:MAG: phosphatase PAP2 family protein [Chloroflexi bacterium]|nr:phosphatase PAP2 family protein [Chloroflexota bacterium]
MQSFDLKLFYWINDLAGRVNIMDRFLTLMATDYFMPVLLSLILLGLWFAGRGVEQRERYQRVVILAVVSISLANLALFILNRLYFRPRPFVGHEVNMLFYPPTDSSFPSNPATVAFAVATAVWIGNHRGGVVLYALAALYSFARVYVGVHYPLDVVGGALIGGGISLITYRFLQLVEPLPTLFLKLARLLYLA